MGDRFFYYAVILSLAIHAGVLTHFLVTHRDFEPWKKPVEMAYNLVKPESKQELKAVPSQEEHLFSEVLDQLLAPPKPLDETNIANKLPPPPDQTALLKEPDIMDNVEMFDRKPERLKGVKVTKEVSVPMLKSDKINTPSYITYYQIVRDRIRDRAYSNYTKLSMGEVFVTFIIKSDGGLSGLQVLEAKSAANDFLRDVGVKSVQEAAPFPPFPKDLSYPELTFNVSISFQYREE